MKIILKLAVLSIALISLSACMSEAEKLAMFRTQCAQFGFQPGTKDYAKCVQKQSIAYEQNENMQNQTYALRSMANKNY